MSKIAIADVKRAYNIVDVIQQDYNIELKFQGGYDYLGICPFHNDRTPSMRVSSFHQNFKCFSCDESGDVISFTEKKDGLSFKEALHYLAEQKGLLVEDENEEEKEKARLIHVLKQIHKDAWAFYRSNFEKVSDSHLAKKDVTIRNIPLTDDYGYALDKSDALYQSLKGKYSGKDLLESGLVRKNEERGNYYDFFRNRLMFVFTDYMGNPISFSGRVLSDKGKVKNKYINGPTTLLFSKKKSFYGLSRARNSARKNKKIYIVEGQFDVEAFHAVGVENVVAVSGTALTSHHAKDLMNIVSPAGEVCLLFDADEAGISAMKRSFENVSIIHKQLSVVTLAKGKDASDYVKANKSELLINKLEKKKDFITFFFSGVKSEYDFSVYSERARFKEEAKSLLSFISDKDFALHAERVLSVMVGETIKKDKKQKKKNYNGEKEESSAEENKIPKMSASNTLYVKALTVFVDNLQDLKGCLPKNLPSHFQKFVDELKEKFNQSKKDGISFVFIPEDYKSKKVVECLLKQGLGETIYDQDEDIKKFFTSLIRQAEKEKMAEEDRKRKRASNKELSKAKSLEELIQMLS